MRNYLLRGGFRPRAAVAAGAVALLGAGVEVPASRADLASQLSAAHSREAQLRSGIGSDSSAIGAFEGRMADIRARLDAISQVFFFERRQLASLRGQLAAARSEQALMAQRLAYGRQLLASQLVADYEGDRPDLVSVVMSSRGFADLLERADRAKRISQANQHTINAVAGEQRVLTAASNRLAVLEAHQRRVFDAELIQRDEVLRLRAALIERERPYRAARARRQAELSSLRTREAALAKRLAAVDPTAALAAGVAPGTIGSFAAHGGNTGFFPAPGTDYSAGVEPVLAARLDALGRALGLHLIGISGYRSPQHSVEVGGFANDPHTRGQASDTPGVEGVPEAVLNRFGLTRPFPGPAEADHIQLSGSA